MDPVSTDHEVGGIFGAYSTSAALTTVITNLKAFDPDPGLVFHVEAAIEKRGIP
jgi:hypothetical protein